MKFDLKQNESKHFFWVLLDDKDTTILKGNCFAIRSQSIEELESFSLQVEHAPVLHDGALIAGNAPNPSSPVSLTFVVKKLDDTWGWDALDSTGSVVFNNTCRYPGRNGFKTLDEACRDAAARGSSIAFSPIYDGYGVLVNALHFSRSFAASREIEDPHPSARKYKR